MATSTSSSPVHLNDDRTSVEEVFTLLDEAPGFVKSKHVKYIATLSSKLEQSFEGALTQHLKLSGIYWSVTAMALLDDDYDENMKLSKEIVPYVVSCFHKGGYSGSAGQGPHLLYTLSAIQILALANAMHLIPLDEVVSFISSCQLSNGSFVGSPYDEGEVDTRFSYCALSAMSMLNRLDSLNVDKAADYILQCRNYDGGFGSCIGAESHAGQVFCCVAALSICKRLEATPSSPSANQQEVLEWWLSERQCDSGGLNGRSEKQADVCYSWWILSAMSILNCTHYIDANKLATFILKAQDPTDGGIADRPDDMPDVFHTFFGVAGLDLLGLEVGPARIDPVYALPVTLVQKLRLQAQVVEKEERPTDPRLLHYTQHPSSNST